MNIKFLVATFFGLASMSPVFAMSDDQSVMWGENETPALVLSALTGHIGIINENIKKCQSNKVQEQPVTLTELRLLALTRKKNYYLQLEQTLNLFSSAYNQNGYCKDHEMIKEGYNIYCSAAMKKTRDDIDNFERGINAIEAMMGAKDTEKYLSEVKSLIEAANLQKALDEAKSPTPDE